MSDNWEPRIDENLNGRLHGNVANYIEHACLGGPWLAANEAALRAYVTHAGPAEHASPQLLSWLLQLPTMVEPPRSWTHFPQRGKNSSRIASLSLQSPCQASSDGSDQWRHILAIACVASTEDCHYLDIFTQLYDHAREVFLNQPARFFLRGFCIRGQCVEFWTFDRGGAYSSPVMELFGADPTALLSIAAFMVKTEPELGSNTFISVADRGHESVRVLPEVLSEYETLYLESDPALAPTMLVKPTPLCYRARRSAETADSSFMVKFVWRDARRRKEEAMLRLARSRNVQGVVQLFSYDQVTTVPQLRQGLRLGDPLMWKSSDDDDDDGRGFGIQSVTCTSPADDDLADLSLLCVVVEPLGRPINTYANVPQLLSGLVDIIRAHRSLLQSGRILHQDIGVGNMILVDDRQRSGHAKGVMIDLDIAHRMDDPPPPEGTVQGTKMFMAIGVLKAHRHTARHDMEALFYCFLWMAIAGGDDGVLDESRLKRWVRGDEDECAAAKSEDMADDNFGLIVAEFTPNFGPPCADLAHGLNRLFFPVQDGSFFKGSDASAISDDELYDAMIPLFEQALRRTGEALKD